MLTNRHPDQLACYLRRLETALDPDTALQCFGNREAWDAELNDYAYGLSFASRSAPVEVRDLVATTSPIHDAAVHAVLALLDLMVLPTASAQFRPEREERARRNLARALALDPGQLLGGVLTATRFDSDSSKRAEVATVLVKHHPDDWRVWVTRVWTGHLTRAEAQQAIEASWRLAPNQPEVIRMAALWALRQHRWADARQLGLKALIKGVEELDDRVTLAIASAQLGSCDEAITWSRSLSDPGSFKKRLAQVQHDLEVPPADCPPPPTPRVK